jgi:hypothetical protein
MVASGGEVLGDDIEDPFATNSGFVSVLIISSHSTSMAHRITLLSAKIICFSPLNEAVSCRYNATNTFASDR